MPFRAEAVLDVSAEKIFGTLMDWENKHNWSPKLKRVFFINLLVIISLYFLNTIQHHGASSDREFLMLGEYRVALMVTLNSLQPL